MLSRVDGEKPVLDNEAAATAMAERVKNTAFVLSKLTSRPRQKKPKPPFITSTLQQQAGSRLNYSPRRTMAIAQQLYEGISLGKRGTTGLITYMRTDSVRVSPEIQKAARDFCYRFLHMCRRHAIYFQERPQKPTKPFALPMS